MKKSVGIITNASAASGVGSRAYEIAQRMQTQDDFDISLVTIDGGLNSLTLHPTHPPLEKGRGIAYSPPFQGGVRGGDVRLRHLPGFLNSKSISWLRLAKHVPKFDVYDISNQTLAFIAKHRHPSIVTVHDLIDLTDPQDIRASLLNRYLLSGVMHADRIVTVSEYTKKVVAEHYGIAAERITVIPNGVSELYEPIENFRETIACKQLVQDYGIQNRTPLIMHVGSEHPRKNLDAVLQTIALLKKQYPEILLLKIGEPGLRSGRAHTLQLIDKLGLRQNVKFLGSIPLDRINELYNIADALLFPSKLEGFGLPPLEAMAAGCPVVCSNTTSLPEVVGDGGLMHDPENTEAFAASITHILTNTQFRNDLIERGKKRSRLFSWDTAARDMLDVYREFI